MKPMPELFRLKALVCDVDGTLTDGGLYYGPAGECMKRFDVRDGHGLMLARQAGFRLAFLTARTSDIVTARARELHIDVVLQGQKDKDSGFTRVCEALGVEAEEVAYMGDDLNDLPALARAGLAAAPADAAAQVRAAAHWVSSRPGGHGAVRELCEFLVEAREKPKHVGQ